MILCTGSAGFMGQHLVQALKRDGQDVLMCDPKTVLPNPTYAPATAGQLMRDYGDNIEAVFHLGAISDTTCADKHALLKTNILLSLRLANFCAGKNIPFIFASSASVYGNGNGPLNDYARSKRQVESDLHDLTTRPTDEYALRLFNVYGPGDEAKGYMTSMVSKALRGKKQFYDPSAARDFVHVDDVVSVMLWCWRNRPPSGIYDVGTGQARTVREMCGIVGIEPEDIGVPIDQQGKLQTHTQADLTKLRAAGYDKPFLSLEEGIARMRP